jgi:ABC-2 type transport system permease protein
MIRKIALKELTELARAPWLRAAVMVYFALLLAALAGHGWLQFRAGDETARWSASARRTWIEQGNKSPHAAAHFGMLAIPPRPALAMIDPGTLPLLGQVAHLQAHQPAWFAHSPANAGSSLLRFFLLTPAFCLRILFPLLLVLLLHAISASERESGMERVLDALGANRATLFFGKITGGGMAAGGLAFASLGLTVLAFLILGGGNAEDFSSLMLLSGLYLLYYLIFFWLGLAVSALARTAGESLNVLLALWIGLCVLVPAWAAGQGQPTRAPPSGIEFARIQGVDSERGFPPDFPPRALRQDNTLQMMLTSFQVGRREQLPVSFPALFLMSEEEVTSLIAERRLAPLLELQKAQTKAMRDAAAYSPSTGISTLSQILCGTDYEHRLAVTVSTETYRRRAIRILNRNQSSFTKETGPVYEAGKPLWDSINPYGVTLGTRMIRMQDESRQIVVLLCWVLASTLAAFGVTFLPRLRQDGRSA